MSKNRINIGVLLGDPSGIGPELISKLLKEKITDKVNVVVIGEKNILNNGDKISGNNNNFKVVNKFDDIDFTEGNKFFFRYFKWKKPQLYSF